MMSLVCSCNFCIKDSFFGLFVFGSVAIRRLFQAKSKAIDKHIAFWPGKPCALIRVGSEQVITTCK